jgi:hypothetical protein
MWASHIHHHQEYGPMMGTCNTKIIKTAQQFPNEMCMDGYLRYAFILVTLCKKI